MEGDTEFWTSHVEACQRGVQAASAYARQHGLTLASLYYWRRKLKLSAAVGDSSSAPANRFVAMRVMDAAVGASISPCILVLLSGLRLDLAALPPPAYLLGLEQAYAGVR